MKYLLLINDYNNLLLKEETAKALQPNLTYEEINTYYDSHRSDKNLIDYLEKHGINDSLNNENAEIWEVEEDENFTFKVESIWNAYDDCMTEDLVRIPIISKSNLKGKTPEEIIYYLKSLCFDFLEG